MSISSANRLPLLIVLTASFACSSSPKPLAGSPKSETLTESEATEMLCPQLSEEELASFPDEPMPTQVVQHSHAGSLSHIEFSPDGLRLATVAASGLIRVWDAARGTTVTSKQIGAGGGADRERLSWINNDEILATGHGIYHWMVYEVDSQKETKSLSNSRHQEVVLLREGPAKVVTYSQEKNTKHGKLTYIDDDGKTLRKFRLDYDLKEEISSSRNYLHSMFASADGTVIAINFSSLTESRVSRIFYVEENTVHPVMVLQKHVIAISADGSTLVAQEMKNRKKGAPSFLVKMQQGHASRSCELPTYTNHAAIDSTGNTLIVVEGRKIHSIDTNTCKTIWSSRFAHGVMQAVALAPDSSEIVVGRFDGSLTRYDAQGGRYLGNYGQPLRSGLGIQVVGQDRLWINNGPIWSVTEMSVSQRKKYHYNFHEIDVTASGQIMEVTEAQPCENGQKAFVLHTTPIEMSANQKKKAVHDLPSSWPPEANSHHRYCVPTGIRSFHNLTLNAEHGTLLYRDRGRNLNIINLKTGGVMPILDEKECLNPTLSADGTTIGARCGIIGVVRGNLSGGPDEPKLRYRVWDTATGKITASYLMPYGLPIDKPSFGLKRIIALSPDGSRVALTNFGQVMLFELPSFRKIDHYHQPGGGLARELLFVGDNDHLVLTSSTGTMHFRTKNGWIRRTENGKGEPPVIMLDGKLLASLGSDHAVRFWNPETAELIATLLPFADEEWILSSPDGSYVGTSEVADRVGWSYDDPSEFFGFEQFKRLRVPDEMQRRLAGKSPIAQPPPGRPPQIELVSKPAAKINGRTAKVEVVARSPRRVDVVRAFVEGRAVAQRRVCASSKTLAFDLPLQAGINRVSLVAYDDRGLASNAAEFDVESEVDGLSKPDLWIVSVGISRYSNLPRSKQLNVADDDARAIADAFESTANSSYDVIHKTVLIDEQATPKAIRKALARLRGMKTKDVAIVFMAGHGYKGETSDDMVFLTSQATMDSATRHSINWADVGAAIKEAKGRVVVFLDACHAGHFSQTDVLENDTLARALMMRERAGAIVFAASKGRQLSYEPNHSRGLKRIDEHKDFDGLASHGLFTAALLKNLTAKESDSNQDGAIQLSELMDAVTRDVSILTRGAQTPWVARRDLIGDFKITNVSP